ncbi:DnaJ-domain-containing protein [Didymella exigua CBS 183.55]|uniref:DnaJ-domain-containing protein n=1 Tax=Didymella exigua CBS 183.55 TaxID=1150837 RepID=A0A6A5R7M0_9PLEO|nr:DnaJ-domain-containing protein [Didymella exigua CBS 183.55]KAF1923168.1 DnaJ-domain-containing protein [Didymella exigua CBS 183.55]
MARKQRKDYEKSSSDDEDIGDEEDGPPTINPYEVLGLDREATADDVKKAYRKMALKHHPDKAAEGEKQTANKKFQEIAFAYAILSDDRRRKRYDLTGSTAESLEDDEDFDWLSFYRGQFENVINEEAIHKLSNEYKSSEEERRDLLTAYKKYKGSLDHMYEAIMLSDILVDDDRFREMIDDAISKGEIELYPAYAKETDETRLKAKKAAKKSRDDFDKRQAAEEAKAKKVGKSNGKAKSKKGGGGDMADLAALIQQRQASRAGGFFDRLEAKYAPKPKGNKRATPMEEPPEEAFQATSARAKKRKQSKKVVVEDDDEDMDLGEEDIGSSDDEGEEEAPRKSKARTKARGRGRVSSIA